MPDFACPVCLADLIGEVEVPVVAGKYNVTKGQVQGLQERAGTTPQQLQQR